MPESKSIVLAKKIVRLVKRSEDKFEGINFMALKIAEEILREEWILRTAKRVDDQMKQNQDKIALGSRVRKPSDSVLFKSSFNGG